MSQFPFAGNSSYQTGSMKVNSPTPAVFSEDFAAVPGVATDQDYPLAKRKVVNHYFTGVDVPFSARINSPSGWAQVIRIHTKMVRIHTAFQNRSPPGAKLC